MRNQLKWGAALGVVIAGGCVSLLFRKDATPPPERLEALDDQLVRRKPAEPHFLVESPPASRFELPGGLAGFPATTPPPTPASQPLASISRLESGDPAPPKLLAKYSVADLDAARVSDWKAVLSPDRPPAESHRVDTRPVETASLNGFAEDASHIVVDGDTLESIAKRYLGDGARKADLYEANRDVLADPELLPIGVELAIPRGPARQ